MFLIIFILIYTANFISDFKSIECFPLLMVKFIKKSDGENQTFLYPRLHLLHSYFLIALTQ